ncbi:RNA-directed DNA polymerase, eukaryota, partial [Tanacetum coccineum]
KDTGFSVDNEHSTPHYPPGFTPNVESGTDVEKPNDTCVQSRQSEDQEDQEEGNSGGILCVWDPNMFKKITSTKSDYFVMIRGVWIPSGKELLIISIYAPHDLREKRSLWEYLGQFICNWDGDVITMGDFNEVRDSSERFGSVFHQQGARHFNDFISKAGLVEIPLGVCSFNIGCFNLTLLTSLSETSVIDNGGGSEAEALQRSKLIRDILESENIVKLNINKVRSGTVALDKSPGPDGLSVGFYRRSFGILSERDLTLLKAVLGSIPTFYMSIFKVPKTVLHSMERIRARFFNGVDGIFCGKSLFASGVGKSHVTARKILAGLGIDEISSHSLSPFVHIWIWTKFITQKKFFVGSCKSCNSWQRVSLNLFVVMVLALLSGTTCGEGMLLSKIWLREFLCSKILRISRWPPKLWKWDLDGSGVFSVSSLRRVIDDAFLPKGNMKTRWVSAIPNKVNILAWKVINDYLPTRFNLSRRDYVVVDSYNSWNGWISSIRLPSKLKKVFEGICFIAWWSIWNWRNEVTCSVSYPARGDSCKGKVKVAWADVCKPKDQGGLGFKSLELWKKTLLVKHLWNIASRKDSLWVKWINVRIGFHDQDSIVDVLDENGWIWPQC